MNVLFIHILCTPWEAQRHMLGGKGGANTIPACVTWMREMKVDLDFKQKSTRTGFAELATRWRAGHSSLCVAVVLRSFESAQYTQIQPAQAEGQA